MSIQAIIGGALAKASLAKARALGETITLSHRGGTPITLYVVVPKSLGGGVGDVSGPHLTEARAISLVIPTGQTGFAYATGIAEPVSGGDIATWRGRTWEVTEAQWDEYGYVYTVKLVDSKVDALGVK